MLCRTRREGATFRVAAATFRVAALFGGSAFALDVPLHVLVRRDIPGILTTDQMYRKVLSQPLIILGDFLDGPLHCDPDGLSDPLSIVGFHANPTAQTASFTDLLAVRFDLPLNSLLRAACTTSAAPDPSCGSPPVAPVGRRGRRR
jgi:hypothetical protein